MKIAENILAILAECEIKDNTLFLPGEQLERKTYETVNKCIDSIGGKWNRKAKGHVFDYDPTESLENLIFTGETEDMKKTFQFFPTPRPVAEMMCNMTEINSNSDILEPSIGRGDLADVIWEQNPGNLTGIEKNREMERYLNDKPYTSMTGVDFLDFAEDTLKGNINKNWTHIIMNPPFAKQQDISHIWAAYEILQPSKELISVVSPSPFFRTDKKSVAFRNWLGEVNAQITEVPEGAFKESGTMIRTLIIHIKKPKCDSTESAKAV